MPSNTQEVVGIGTKIERREREREREREGERERENFNNLSDVLNASCPIVERNLLENLQQIFPVKTSAAF
jgi:hypothetical protein